MIKIIKEIRVEVSKPNLFQAIVAKQYDMNSRYLKATFVNDGVVLPIVKTSSVLVSINAKRSDGESRAFYGEVNDDNTVLVPIDSWMLSLDGEVTCDISVIEVDASTNVEKRLTSTTFTLLVERAVFNIDDGEISDEEQENFINGLIIECQTATAAANAAATECREFIDANALKINKTGTIVSANDVSPVEHELKVKVSSDTVADLTAVNVTRTGKNLLPYPYVNTTKTVSGVTFTDNGDGTITANGTSTGNIYYWLNAVAIKQNTNYTASGFPKTSYTGIYFAWQHQDANGLAVATSTDRGDTVTFQAHQDAVKVNLVLAIQKGSNVENIVFKPQLELGSTATEFEVYKEPQTVTPKADGIVDGLTSISPNMTVFADKGVNIDLTYIADTKMYIDNKFAELQAAIISLGGNV